MASTFTAAPDLKSARYPSVCNFVGGRFAEGGNGLLEVVNPSDGSLLSRVPLSSSAQVDAAVRAAGDAFPAWSATPIKERVQVFFRYRSLLERHLDDLAALISEEHGKIRSEAEAELLRAIELTEFACSLPPIVTGEVLGKEGHDEMESRSGRELDVMKRSTV